MYYGTLDQARLARALEKYGVAYGISYTFGDLDRFTRLISLDQVPPSFFSNLVLSLKSKKKTKSLHIYKFTG